MLSLKKLLGKDDKFFDLLEAGAEEAKTAVDLFSAYLKKVAVSGSGDVGALDDFIQTRRKEKRIRHLMTEELSKTFVTPLEREDIEALSFALYRIPKQLEKIVRRIRDSAVGRRNYSGIDLIEDVKCACAREGVIFDNDLFNELVRQTPNRT